VEETVEEKQEEPSDAEDKKTNDCGGPDGKGKEAHEECR
jgi:hypothetical protein